MSHVLIQIDSLGVVTASDLTCFVYAYARVSPLVVANVFNHFRASQDFCRLPQCS